MSCDNKKNRKAQNEDAKASFDKAKANLDATAAALAEVTKQEADKEKQQADAEAGFIMFCRLRARVQVPYSYCGGGPTWVVPHTARLDRGNLFKKIEVQNLVTRSVARPLH